MSSNTLIYCRVSSAKQGEKDCVSLEAQEAKIKDFCKSQKGEIISSPHKLIIHEIGSAFYAQQPKLKMALQELKEGDQIYVYSYDRLSRNMQRFLSLLEDLEKRKIKLISATEPIDYSQASGRMHLMTVIANAECQSRTISQKVKTAYQYRKTNGLLKARKPKEYFEKEQQESILMLLIGLRSGRRTVEEMNLILKEIVKPEGKFSPLVIDDKDGNPVIRPVEAAISFDNIATILFDYGLTPKKMKAALVRKIYQDNKDLDMSSLEARLKKMEVSKKLQESKELKVTKELKEQKELKNFKDSKDKKEVKEAKEEGKEVDDTMVMDMTSETKPNPNEFNLEELFKQMNILKAKVEQHLKMNSIGGV